MWVRWLDVRQRRRCHRKTVTKGRNIYEMWSRNWLPYGPWRQRRRRKAKLRACVRDQQRKRVFGSAQQLQWHRRGVLTARLQQLRREKALARHLRDVR